VRDLLSYYSDGSTIFKAHVLSHYEKVMQDVEHYPLAVQEDVRRLAQHLKVVMDEKQAVDQMIMMLTSSATAQQVDELLALYSHHHETLVHRANVYRLYLYLFAVALLIYVAFIM